MLLEQFIIYGSVLLFCAAIIFFYLRGLKRASKVVEAKIEKAKEEGLHEPVSLHPVIDLDTCIKSAACVEVCPEKDILGILNGGGVLINASNCVGHGACFHACPVDAITLVIGTEKRGVDLPHLNENYETNVPGIFIAGELGGMGLIKNSVEQGVGAVEYMVKEGINRGDEDVLDLVIVGAGPAGIAASLTARKHGLTFATLEQDTLGGTVFTFPRSKIVMTAPMELPLYGKVKLFDTSKAELLDLWQQALSKNGIAIRENTKVESIAPGNGVFEIVTQQQEVLKAQKILLAIGRRGSPRKLGIPGEMTEKVAYRLLDPELIEKKRIVVVGGGDSAVEAALSLAAQNEVILSYRRGHFSRIKSRNREKIQTAIDRGDIEVRYHTNLVRIERKQVVIEEQGGEVSLPNDLVYIFAGGELPTQFLKKAGVQITTRFGYTMKKHR